MNAPTSHVVPSDALELLISTRRTSKPADFDGRKPDRSLVRRCIDVARKAPNHHRTEPAYFYLLDREQIREVAKLNAERVAGEDPISDVLEKAARKKNEWEATPGLLVITCHTDRDSDLVRAKPAVVEEDYAAVCCMTQNLLLLLHNHGISTKWSTAPVWEHARFEEVVNLKQGLPDERVVALIFHGFTQVLTKERSFRPIDEILMDKSSSE